MRHDARTATSARTDRLDRPTIGETALALALDESVLESPLALTLPSGRTVACTEAGGPEAVEAHDRITIRGGDGEVELDIVFTPTGPRLRFRAAELALEAQGRVTVECDAYHVHTRGDIVHRAGGDLHQQAAGDAQVSAEGELHVRGQVAEVEATRGDARLKANDDVKLRGERIMLNC